MKALCWHGTGDVRIDNVPEPRIEYPGDAIIRVTSAAICGSDLHILNGFVSHMHSGDILGHEFMGEVVELGSDVTKLQVGDRVVVPFTISCGECEFCRSGQFALCDRSNPNADIARENLGQSPAGVFGYSHLLGGFSGGQAEYVRVPFADVGPIRIPDELPDDKVLFLSDVFPTGYMAAENCQIEPGDTVAVWGCGPVGQFAIQCAWMFGAGRVIAIDRVPERLRMAAARGRAETINFDEFEVYEQLMAMTRGRGPDSCIDAVGCEAHGGAVTEVLDKAKGALMMGSDRPHVLAEAIRCCRKGGTLSIPGVYVDGVSIPLGMAMNKGLTFRMGQTHMQQYLRPLLKVIEAGDIDPSFIVTHRMKLDDAPEAYKTFRDKADGCVKVLLTP